MAAPLHILVIEDHPADFRLIERHLSRHGLEAQCHRASSRQEIDAALSQGGWDLVISDYGLPGLDFQSTLAPLLARETDLPFILVSGSLGEDKALELLKLGVSDFVLKDNLVRLVPAIRRSLQEAADRRQHSLAENARIASEARYRRLFESAIDGILILHAETGAIEDANPALLNLLGLRREDLRAKSAWDLPALTEIAPTPAAFAARRDAGPIRLDSAFLVRQTDGHRIPVEFVAIHDREGSHNILQWSFRDITLRRTQELEIRRLNRLYATLSRISQGISAARTREELLDGVCRIVADSASFKLVWIGRADDLTQRIIPLASAGTAIRYLDNVELYADDRPAGQGPAGTCLRSGQTCVQNDFLAASRGLPWFTNATTYRLRAVAAIPLSLKAHVWGALMVYDGEINAFQDKEVTLLEEAARIVSRGLESLETDAHRRTAEAALLESAARLRTLGDNLPGGALYQLLSLPGGRNRYTYMSAGMERILGMPVARILSNPAEFWDLIVEEDRPALDAAQARSARELTLFSKEFRQRTVTGDIRWLSARASPRRLPDGSLLWDGVVTDITDAKRVELEHLRLATAIDQASEMIFITAADGTILYLNPAFERITGYSRQEALGRNPRFLKSGHHDAAFYANLWQTIASGSAWSGRLVNRRKDGSLYHEDANIAPMRDAHGHIVNFVAVKRDVTREVELESQFRQAQKTEAIGQLAGGVAHDFNNLLAAILMQTDLALQDEHVGPDTRSSIHDIRHAAERAASLTRQLLLFSRREILQPRTVDLNDCVTQLARMLTRLLGEHITLDLHLAPIPLWIQADPGMIDQVIVNLAVNARDAMPDGGRLTIESASVTLPSKANTTTTSTTGNPTPPTTPHARLTIHDTGSGIPPDVLPRIFEPFFTTKAVGKGTGLGLATVDGIVRQHHGWIEVASTPGTGTTFTLHLPAAAPGNLPTPASQPGTQPPQGSETILLVEDEERLRKVTRIALQRRGYLVLEATQGSEAIAIASNPDSRIDLLVTDMVLPGGMDGRSIAERLRRDRPTLKVIFISGYSPEFAGRSLHLDPGQEFLPKPYTPLVLLSRIRACLDTPIPPPPPKP